jgi:hypothetical protein
MHRLLHRALCRIESEEKAHDIKEGLLEYLRHHGVWLRSETLHLIARRLHFTLTDNEVYCIHDVRVWMPDLEFWLLHGTPATTKVMKALSRYLFKMKNFKKHRMRRLTENGFEPLFSPDITHLCRGMGVKTPSCRYEQRKNSMCSAY